MDLSNSDLNNIRQYIQNLEEKMYMYLNTSAALLGDIKIFTTPVFNTSTTFEYEKPNGLKFITVEAIGGGGGGGGAAGNNQRGAGGGGGAYSFKKISYDDLELIETLIVGGAGLGGASGANKGLDGAASKFGDHLVAGGGGGGQPGGGAFVYNQGVATGGDLNIDGQSGVGRRLSGSDGGGIGGSSPLGFSVVNTVGTGYTAANDDGRSAWGYGGGGTGGFRLNANVYGGNGSPGLIIVKEYF